MNGIWVSLVIAGMKLNKIIVRYPLVMLMIKLYVIMKCLKYRTTISDVANAF